MSDCVRLPVEIAVLNAKIALAALAALSLAACSSTAGLAPVSDRPLAAPTVPVQGAPLAGGAQIGAGPVRVALILPLTQGSGPSVVGTSLRNGAELEIEDARAGGAKDDHTVLVKDDGSSPDGARAAAQNALNEGAELILGPLFAPNVKEVAKLARAAGRPMIAFSTDTTAASRNAYLLSFLIESYVDRIVDFAAAKGKKSFAVLAPENEYGNVAVAEFQQAAARRGVRVQAIERYAAGGALAAVQKVALVKDQIDALFVPEQADAMANVSQALVANGLGGGPKLQILGTGLWNDARILKLPALQGAWFAAPENGGFNAFAEKYRKKFGSDPTRIATLSYDAVSLVSALARTQGAQRFSEGVLTSASGFNGADGVFRFRPDGQNERGLSVLQIGGGTTKAISPAPRSFAAGAVAQQ